MGMIDEYRINMDWIRTHFDMHEQSSLYDLVNKITGTYRNIIETKEVVKLEETLKEKVKCQKKKKASKKKQ